MTITVIKEGPYYATAGTPISFSSLRTNFKESSSGKISASEFIKNTNVNESNPIIPDATENANIVTTTANGVTLSQFRNSIKRYKIKQSTVGGESAETNFDIDAQDWNSNLGKNIQKTFEVTGVIGATSITNAAATFNATAYNLKIHVFGHIYGQGGAAGAAGVPNGGNGGNGGPALSVTNQVANKITVAVVAGGRIFGGGGGGGGGNKGADGSPGTAGTKPGGTTSTNQTLSVGTRCSNQTFNGQKGESFYFAYACAAAGYTGYNYTSTNVAQNCGNGHTNFAGTCTRTVVTDKDPIATAGGTAGIGGNGGAGGQGKGYTTDRSDGVGGGPGGAFGAGGGGTATNGTPGKTGITGGNGGDYGVKGTAADPGGTGGTAGRAITGTNYSVTGTISADTVKGLYNP